MLINHAKESDAHDIMEVFYRAWLATYPSEMHGITREDIEENFRDRLDPERLQRRAHRYANPPPNEPWLVARYEKKVIGLITPVRKVDRNQLQRIYVLPLYQHIGVGKLLWEAAQVHFHSKKDTYVEVASYNEQAILFYRRLGFVPTHRIWYEGSYKFKSGAQMPQMEMIRKAP